MFFDELIRIKFINFEKNNKLKSVRNNLKKKLKNVKMRKYSFRK